MAFFKKPVVAVLFSIILVIASTLISVNVNLNRECRAVSEGFYTGSLHDGNQEDSLFELVNSVRAYADELSIMASDNGIDNEDITDYIDDLQYAFTYCHYDISYINYNYNNMYTEMQAIAKSLSNADISDKDVATLESITAEMRTVNQQIQNSGYNDSVREYLLEYQRFPTELLGDMAGVDAPEYFS